MKKILCLILSFFILSSNLMFADDEAESYDSVNFPQWAKDLRRTEIITFGSLPFVTIWTTVIYSYAVYGEFQNPLDKSNSSFTEDDQWMIIKMSAATCLALGLVDLGINLILRRMEKNKKNNASPQNEIEILKLNDIEGEAFHDDEDPLKADSEKNKSEYLFSGVESAVF